MEHHVGAFPCHRCRKHCVAAHHTQVHLIIGIAGKGIDHLLDDVILFSGIRCHPYCELFFLLTILVSLGMNFEVIGKRTDKGIPGMGHIGKEAAVCTGKLISLPCHHQIIHLQRQVVDAVDPLAQGGEFGVEIAQVLGHIVRLLDQFDHGVHHVHHAGSLVGHFQTLAKHFHHSVQPGVLHFKNILHMRDICSNLIITVLVRICPCNRREFTV